MSTAVCQKHGVQPLINLGDHEVACSECYQATLRGLKKSEMQHRRSTGVFSNGSITPPKWMELLK